MKMIKKTGALLVALVLLLTACGQTVPPVPESSAFSASSQPPQWPQETPDDDGTQAFEGDLHPWGWGAARWDSDSQQVRFCYESRLLVTLDRDNNVVSKTDFATDRFINTYYWNDNFVLALDQNDMQFHSYIFQQDGDWKLVNGGLYTVEGEEIREQPTVEVYNEEGRRLIDTDPLAEYLPQIVNEATWLDDTYCVLYTALRIFLYDVQQDKLTLMDDLSEVFLENYTDVYWPATEMQTVGAYEGRYFYTANRASESRQYKSGLWMIDPALPQPVQLIGEREYEGFFLRDNWILPYKSNGEWVEENGETYWRDDVELWAFPIDESLGEDEVDPQPLGSAGFGQVVVAGDDCLAFLRRNETSDAQLVFHNMTTGGERIVSIPEVEGEKTSPSMEYYTLLQCQSLEGEGQQVTFHYSAIRESSRYDFNTKTKVIQQWGEICSYNTATGEWDSRKGLVEEVYTPIILVSPDGTRVLETTVDKNVLRVIPLDWETQ